MHPNRKNGIFLRAATVPAIMTSKYNILFIFTFKDNDTIKPKMVLIGHLWA